MANFELAKVAKGGLKMQVDDSIQRTALFDFEEVLRQGPTRSAALAVMRLGQFAEWFLSTNEPGTVKLRTDLGVG